MHRVDRSCVGLLVQTPIPPLQWTLSTLGRRVTSCLWSRGRARRVSLPVEVVSRPTSELRTWRKVCPQPKYGGRSDSACPPPTRHTDDGYRDQCNFRGPPRWTPEDTGGRVEFGVEPDLQKTRRCRGECSTLRPGRPESWCVWPTGVPDDLQRDGLGSVRPTAHRRPRPSCPRPPAPRTHSHSSQGSGSTARRSCGYRLRWRPPAVGSPEESTVQDGWEW